MAVRVIKGILFEDGGGTNIARVANISGTNITQASLSSIYYSVFDMTTSQVILASTQLTIANVVFDTLQTAAVWTLDSTGYNFRHDFAATCIPEGDHVYRFEYKFTPGSGEVFWQPFEITTLPIYTS